MAMDCSKLPSSVQNMENTNRATARLTLLSTTVAGIFFVSRAVVCADFDWGLLAMVAFTVVFSALSAYIKQRSESPPVSVPLSHLAMFAGALALGPAAALIGAFNGISSLLFSPPQKRSLPDVFYIIFKPAAVCAFVSAVFGATGGEAAQPQSVCSAAPALLSGFAYVIGQVLATAGIGASKPESGETPRGTAVAASWLMCLLGGYTMAVLYSTAPAYVMAAPIAAGVAALSAMRNPVAIARVAEEPVVEEMDDAGKQGEPVREAITPSVFVDELTGLASHRYLMMFLDREVNRSLRTGSSLAVAAVDIDGFSKLEDADAVLVQLGRQLKTGLRDYDLVARHSSGRLVVVLPDTMVNSAIDVCKRLHSETCSVEVNGKPLSVSVGIALLPDNGISSEELINASHYAINKGRFSGEGGVHVCERLDRAS